MSQKKKTGMSQSHEICCQPKGNTRVWRILSKLLEIVQLQPNTLKTSDTSGCFTVAMEFQS